VIESEHTSHGDLDSLLTSYGIDPKKVDNYDYIPAGSSEKYSRSMGLSVSGKDLLVIYYKSLGRETIEDQGVPFKRVRVLQADKDTPKYLSPVGSSSHIYLPMTLEQALQGKDYVVITEGEKKADIACIHGIPTIALAGVYMWSDPFTPKSEDSPHLNEHTPLHPELVDVLTQLSIKKVLVVFDSDGALLDKNKIPKHELSTYQAFGKKFCKNTQVFRSAHTLSKAIATQLKIPTHVEFCEVKVKELQSHTIVPIHKAVKVETVVKNGLDDWILLDGSKKVQATIEYWTSLCALPMYVKDPGYIPLGYSSEGKGIQVYVWNTIAQTVLSSSISKLNQDTAILELLGPSGASRFQEIKDNGEVKYNKIAACQSLYDECVGDGKEWDPQAQARGAGVWLEEDGLVVNGPKSLIKIDADGRRSIERCSLSRNKVVYPKPPRGPTCLEVAPDTQQVSLAVMKLIKNIQTFSWATKIDFVFMVGWMLLQSYTGALHRRPHLYIFAESGSGKTTLNEYVHEFLSDVSVLVESGTDTTAAGIRQYMGVHSGVMIIDEMDRTEEVLSGKKHDNTQAIFQSMRASYSSLIDEESQYRVSSLKGTASGRAQVFASAISYMLSSVSVPELQQADANRMIMLSLNKNKDRSEFLNKDSAREDGILIRSYMLQFHVWTAFQKKVQEVFQYLRGNLDERQRWTISMPVAAFLSVLECCGIPTGNESEIIRACLEAYKISRAAEDSTPEYEKVWNKFLLSSARVEFIEEDGDKTRTFHITESWKNIISLAITADKWKTKKKDGPYISACKRHNIIYQNIQDKEFIFIGSHCNVEIDGVPLFKYRDILSQNPDCDKNVVAKIDGVPVRGVRIPINPDFYTDLDDLI